VRRATSLKPSARTTPTTSPATSRWPRG
jgi:hypothetical protein